MPGVVGVFASDDLKAGALPPADGPWCMARPIVATEIVRFVGERVAIVVGETRRQAVDATERVAVDYEPLESVTDVDDAMAPDATLLFPEHGTNIVMDKSVGDDDWAEKADIVVAARFHNQRVAPLPLETNAALAVPERGGRLTLWVSCQAQFTVRDDIASALEMAPEDLDVVSPAVGGGFGAKIDTYPEHVAVAALARELQRPVRYVETRSENLAAMTHGRDQIQEIQLGASADGRLVGLRTHLVADIGAYPQGGSLLPKLTRQMLSGVYRISRIQSRITTVLTNKTPVAAYRGAGRPEAAALLERAVDMVGARLGLDPVEVRRRNFIPGEAFPYKTPTRAIYDSGEYAVALSKALDIAGYDKLRTEQRMRRERKDVRLLGIGLSTYVEVTGMEGAEYGAVEIHDDGSVEVTTGISPHGQGHETALMQLVSSELRVPMETVSVVHSDTRRVPRGNGTMASRSLQLGGSAVARCTDTVIRRAKLVAGRVLEASVEDLAVQDDGRIGVAGAPQRSIAWSRLARLACDPELLPSGEPPGLRAHTDFDPEAFTYPFGAHVSVVEVDVETGKVVPLRHVAVDDCGRILNPLLVEGQVHGGLAQGIGQALYEEVLYDPEGQLLTEHLGYYRMASAAEMCSFERSFTETHTPLNPLGAKGVGESATIGSTPAVQNAVVDALAHLGVEHMDMPLTPERVWRALNDR